MKTTLLLFILALPFSALAIDVTPLSSLTVGIQSWNSKHNPNPQKDINPDDASNVKLAEDGDISIFAQFTHPVLFVPNIQIESTILESQTTEFNVSNLGSLIDDTLRNSTNLDTAFNINIIDYHLFWRLLVVDVGIGARQINFLTDVTDKTITDSIESASADLTLPTVFVQTKIAIPTTKFYAYGKGIYSTEDTRDIRIAIGYDLKLPVLKLGIEVGFRDMAFVIDGADLGVTGLNFDYALNGSYVGFRAKF